MKLDRNITTPRRGKYALIKLREAEPNFSECGLGTEYVSVPASAVDFGNTEDSDFFVIRLKDKYAERALTAYSVAARLDGEAEYADEIQALADLSRNHPSKKRPD